MLGAPHVGLVFGFLGDFFVFGLVFGFLGDFFVFGLVFGFLGDFFVFGLVYVLANIKKDQGKLIWPPLLQCWELPMLGW